MKIIAIDVQKQHEMFVGALQKCKKKGRQVKRYGARPERDPRMRVTSVER